MLDIQVIITGVIGIITTIVGSWTSYIFTKRHRKISFWIV